MTVTVPVRVPVAVGVNVTLMVQLAPAARLAPQLFVCAKSPLLVPVISYAANRQGRSARVRERHRLSGAGRAHLLVAKRDGCRREAPAGAVPVPVRLAVCGLLVALSVTVNAALRVPVAVGVNVTLIVQLEPAATPVPQLFVCANGAAAPMLIMVRAEPPVLESVTA